MAANLLARYIWEINELHRSRHGLTSEELNERWEDCWLYDGKPIIRKTWYEHRQQIGVQFGIDIECDKRTNRYFIANRDEVGRSDLQNWLLNSFAVGNMLMQGKDLKGRILYEDIPSGYEYLTDIIQAMRESKIVSVTYQSFWSDEPATFELKPYCLKVFKQRWYLIAGNVAFEGVRVYGLDRIQDFEITGSKFTMPKDFDAGEFFEPYYGVSVGNEQPQRIRIKVYNGQVSYFRSLPIHDSQVEVEGTADYSVFEYYVVPTYEFKHELLSHGDDVEVLEPVELRNEIKETLRRGLDRYI